MFDHFLINISDRIDIFLMAMLLMWFNVFVLFATKAYKKSIANTILVITIAISITLFRHGFVCVSLCVLIAGSMLSTLRSMSHLTNDSIIRGRNAQ